jgi:SAM-dependent methyltransferase
MQSSVLKSPITHSKNLIEEKTVPISTLVDEYQNILNIDISHLINSAQPNIQLFRCKDSGFRFYYPFDIIGDSNFYHQLEAYEWYYMPTKWEFEEGIKHINGGSLLEIGAAKGDFLNVVRSKFPKARLVGLELNLEAAKKACNRGFEVLVESSSTHAQKTREQYDVVACFQVLEHIPQPMELLNDALSMLKPGGKLILAVPDNSTRAYPSIFVTIDNLLNMPPHHQGLWDILSLTYLQKVLPLKLEYIVTEPAITSHHSNGYRALLKNDLVHRFGKVVGSAIYALARPFYNHALQHLKQHLPAHSILVVYSKVGE